jgi:fatty acid desaturase
MAVEPQRKNLESLRRLCSLFLFVAAGVPMIGALLVVAGTENRLAAAILIGLGLLGLGIAAAAHRAIHRMIDALLFMAE